MADKDPHSDWQGTPEQWAQFEDELNEEFPEEGKRFDEAIDRLIDKDHRASVHVEYCQEYSTNGSKIGICDAALGPNGKCPYEQHHVESE